jgi:hypothetical protein
MYIFCVKPEFDDNICLCRKKSCNVAKSYFEVLWMGFPSFGVASLVGLILQATNKRK